MPPSWCTLSRMTSPSQSRRRSCTAWTCPDSSPLRHRRWRERDQYTARAVAAVSARASRFIQATIRICPLWASWAIRSEEHTSELQSRENLVCRLLLEKKKNYNFLYLHVNLVLFTSIE